MVHNDQSKAEVTGLTCGYLPGVTDRKIERGAAGGAGDSALSFSPSLSL